MRNYEGKHIIRYKSEHGVVTEWYITFKEGKAWLQVYVNFALVEEKLIVDVRE